VVWYARVSRVVFVSPPPMYAQMGAFFYAAKAFDVLERLDPDPEYWEGKRGACVGVLQQVRARAVACENRRQDSNLRPGGITHDNAHHAPVLAITWFLSCRA